MQTQAVYLTDAIAQLTNPSWIIPVKHLPAHWSLHVMHTLERVGTLFALAKRAWGCVIGNSKIPQTTRCRAGESAFSGISSIYLPRELRHPVMNTMCVAAFTMQVLMPRLSLVPFQDPSRTTTDPGAWSCRP